jgi:putative two-component system response regulator
MRSNAMMPPDPIPVDHSVLIVDDDPAELELLTRCLVADGWNCRHVESAHRALASLEVDPAGIVVTAIHLPERSGLWLLDQITALFPNTAVLLLTGSNELRLAVEALMRGASAYLLRPVQSSEFLVHIRQASQRRQLLTERSEQLHSLEQRVQSQTVALRQAHEETIHRLVTAAACRDQETGAHIRRTGLFSEVLARAAGWSAHEAEKLRMAAPMHDIGKIGIPDAILCKPGRLTAQEFELMKRHTTIGARMLAGSSSPVLRLAEKIALSHHEWWNGNGYPQGLAGEQIPEAARIVSIVDVYDALSHDRVYRPAFPEEDVLSAISAGQGTQFDPGLLTLFFGVLDQINAIADANPDQVEESVCERSLLRAAVFDEIDATYSELLSPL